MRVLVLASLLTETFDKTGYKFIIFPQKGTITSGADGDLVIIDLNKEVTCRAEDSYSQAKGIMKVYEDWKLGCSVDCTVVRGRVVMENGVVDESASGWGEFVRPVRNH